MKKAVPHLAFSRTQWPVLVGHIGVVSTRDDALSSALRLLETASQVSCALVDTPGIVALLSGLVDSSSSGGSAEGAPSAPDQPPPPPCATSTRLLALKCLRQLLVHAGYRSAALVEATSGALAAACCAPDPSLRLAAYAALAGAVTGSPLDGAAACVRAGFADSLPLRVLSELPEHGRGLPALVEGALCATRELLVSSGGRAARGIARALTSGLVGALLDAAALPSASEATLDATMAMLAALAADPAGGRPALLAPAAAARAFPALVAMLAYRAPGSRDMRVAAGAASALCTLAVVDEGKREALRAFGGLPCGSDMEEKELPGVSSAGHGLNALAAILIDACVDGAPPPSAAPAALAACGAISTLSQHPTARAAFMAAANIRRQVFEKFAEGAKQGRYGGPAISEALEKACTGAWDAVLWKP